MENKRNLILIGLFVLLALTLGKSAFAQGNEAPRVADSIIVIFQGQTLPADAADRVQRAGGKVVSSLDEVGILVASPVSVDANTLIRNLRKDSAILDADYDRVLQLIAPAQVNVDEENNLSPDTNFLHPFPTFSPALPSDFATSRAARFAAGSAGSLWSDLQLPVGEGIGMLCSLKGMSAYTPGISTQWNCRLHIGHGQATSSRVFSLRPPRQSSAITAPRLAGTLKEFLKVSNYGEWLRIYEIAGRNVSGCAADRAGSHRLRESERGAILAPRDWKCLPSGMTLPTTERASR